MRNAVVTGASRGIGRFVTKELCSRGWRVLGVARSRDLLESLRIELSGCFEYVSADLSDPASIRIVVDAIRDKLGVVHLLVNNAGAGLYRGILEHKAEDVQRLVNLNMVSPILLTIESIPYMPKGSTVVFVLTAAVFVAYSRLPVYGAAKAGLHYLAKIMARELESRGIRVVRVYPGYVETDFHASGGSNVKYRGVKPEAVAKKIVDAVEKGRRAVYIPWYALLARALAGLDHPTL